jgi:predicted nucleic acid-binding protein
VKEAIVTDSACLISLERIGRLELLPALFDPISIPPEVQQEFGIPMPWLRIETPADQSSVTILKMSVDAGEAEAIALARQQGRRIILDDLRARKVAKLLGVSSLGTIGVLIKAKGSGLITDLKPLLDELESKGFYMSADLKQMALRIAGE